MVCGPEKEAKMLAPFGAHVVDKQGKSVGTVSRVILDAQAREVVGLVVHQGVLNRQQFEVPIGKVADIGDEVRLNLSAAEFNTLDFFQASNYRVMSDHWEMPVGFDQREFFMVGGGPWAEATLPFEPTSPDVAGTPRYERDPDAVQEPEPDIAAGTHVYDSSGQHIGEVEGVEWNDASHRITRVTVRRGLLFHTETAIPASMIASAGERITLNVGAEAVKKLARG
jgi:sporulation protein YlmC with PRC-barrel domain